MSDELRRALRGMAEGLEPDSSLSVPVRTRVRHRQAVAAFVAALVLTSVGVASVAGVQALSERASRVPANRVTLPPGPAAPVACTNGWHLAPNPVVSGDFQDSLVAASALASDDIWAVGTGFVTSPTGQTVALFEHWDGGMWTVVKGADTAGRSVRLNAVAAVAPNDVWAVGEYFPSNDESTPFQPLIEHWNGSSWNIVPSPAIGVGEDPFSGRSLEAITVVSADDVWILGHYDINNNVPATQVRDVFEHWDGHAWTVVKSPQDTTGTGISAMQSLSADATNDAWAVGGRVNGLAK